ncbi:RNA 2',3'-cyclic phosphodiesterase [Desulfurivibrio dismutans]|uniref:RNA 2',3'-cyclic phosphodiesterase n=1 Tax=Desulfurivibrio dismutans TaxID=1398908 RepID=UPI0023DA6130|nr:RNA 2',3'-cyclic phosphodiesterase [Desulfurivibrio alkaliphilus]MDF1614203.1 RNA 2',3'-cyclic phosphodiesterase [Desulfurivibrio alkaliphilus]
MYRLFTAIDLPPELAARLAAMGFGLPGARWLPEDQLHLTLRFIGEVDGGRFYEIREALADVRAEPFTMHLQGFGCFPPRGPARILWAGVEPTAPVAALYRKVENVLVRQGLADPEKRKFAPHVTVARLQQPPKSRLGNFLAGNNLYRSEEFTVNQFHLYSSQLTNKGAIHYLEASYDLP